MSITPSDFIADTAPLKVFHCFNDLPLEMRQRIWRFCLPGPRIHRIGWTAKDRPTRSSCIIPTVMRVCQESRKESLHHLKRLPSPCPFYTHRYGIPAGCTSRCYFSPAIDTLLFMDSFQSDQEFTVWVRLWLEWQEKSELRLVQHIAIDRKWLCHSSFIPQQVGELVRLLGNVKVLHLVSLNSHWSLQRWAMWRDVGRVSDDQRVEFTWVDMDEVRKRPIEKYPRLWKEWGPKSLMAGAGPDILSLDGEEALARFGEVVQILEDERLGHPTGWSTPKVQLDFVRYDRVRRDKRILEQEKAEARLKQANAKAFLARAAGELLPQLIPVSYFGGCFGRG